MQEGRRVNMYIRVPGYCAPPHNQEKMDAFPSSSLTDGGSIYLLTCAVNLPLSREKNVIDVGWDRWDQGRRTLAAEKRIEGCFV